MTKIQEYRKQLRRIENWEPFLLKHSGLPGPRGNIELAQAAAEEGQPKLFEQYRSYTATIAPVNSQQEFLAFCGVLGLGRLISEGTRVDLKLLRKYASDTRWRIREAVAMALQRVGGKNLSLLIEEMRIWSKGNLYERRAAAAALCEPKLLNDVKQVEEILEILDGITSSILQIKDRKSDGFLCLRKGLAYCWSVAVAALPAIGKSYMETWFGHADKDIRWIMKENLKKKRLERVDPNWVGKWKLELSTNPGDWT